MVKPVVRRAPDAVSPRKRRWWRPTDPLRLAVVVATAVFALAGIGSPLLGLRVFADTGSLAQFSGYRDVLAGVQVQTEGQRDQVDSQLPNSILFGEAIRSGNFVGWDPYAMGGAPLAGTPNLALASPLSLAYWALPGWLAPAYTKLLELICATGGMYLFLRRLRLHKPAAWLGGLVFASSAFMVVWTGWPQTRVAALIPVLFWALEGVAVRVRVRGVAMLALVVAAMLLGGFPAVTGYALLTAAAYLLVRVVSEHRPPVRVFSEHGWRWRPVAARLAGAAAGVAAGIGLAAWQLLPWLRYMASVLVDQRGQTPDSDLSVVSLLTTIAPNALGGADPAAAPLWFGPLAMVDAESYVGAGVAVLLAASLALAGPTRRLLPRGIWWLLVGATALWGAAIYLGGPLLALLQHLSYLFSDNPVGRARSVLGFLVAVLAAAGFEAVLAGRAAGARTPGSWSWSWSGWLAWAGAHRRRLASAAVWVGLVGGALTVYLTARAWGAGRKGQTDHVGYLDGQVAIGVGIAVLAAACVAWLWFARGRIGGRWARPAAAILLVGLIGGQALWWVQGYYPRADRDDFYPTNPTQTFLADNLGHQRYYGVDGSIYGSVDVTQRLRSFHGHAFIEQGYADLAQALPGDQFPAAPTTAIISPPDDGTTARSPVLDRAAVSYYVTPPEVAPFGPAHASPADGPPVTLVAGTSVTVPLPVAGPLRGVGVRPVFAGSVTATVEVSVLGPAGQVLATGARPAVGLAIDQPWLVPVAGEDVPAGAELHAAISVVGDGAVTVAGTAAGQPAVVMVSAPDDGLRLVYARESVIYQRTTALARARWASSTVVESDRKARVALLAGDRVAASQVVLDAPGPAGDGRPAQVTWVDDGLDQMVLGVQADGTGYLVLADAIQTGWRVTVDGVGQPLVAADHAFAAVAVGPGSHTVRFFYPGPLRGAGAWLSGLTALTLLLGVTLETVFLRRRSVA